LLNLQCRLVHTLDEFVSELGRNGYSPEKSTLGSLFLLRDTAREVEEADLPGWRRLSGKVLALYGGMGSLNDIALPQALAKEEARLRALAETLYALAIEAAAYSGRGS